MKKLISIILVITLLLTVSACAVTSEEATSKTSDEPSQAEDMTSTESSTESSAESQESSEKPLRIVFVTPLIAHPVFLVAKEGFDDAAEKFDFQGDWIGPSNVNVEEMINIMETCIAEKVDGIITVGTNPEAMIPVMKKCDEAGIPVVVVNSDIPDAPRLAYIGTEPVNFGHMAAEAVLEKMGDTPIKAAYMAAKLDYQIGVEQIAAYEEVLKTAPGGYERMTVSADKVDTVTSIQTWESIFEAYPETNLAVCVCANSGPAAAKVIQEKNLVGKVTIIAIDDIDETLDGINNGTIFATMTQNFYQKGYQAAQLICDYVRNGKKPSQLKIDSGTIVVTKDNLGTYNKDFRNPDAWE